MVRFNHDSGIKDNIPKYYALWALMSLGFFTPIFVVFLQANSITLANVMILESIYSLVMAICLIPSGALADLIGRKPVIELGVVASVMAIVLFGIGTDFVSFAAAEVLWGIGNALFFGVESAFIYDTLKAMRREKEAKQVFANAYFYMLLFVVLGSAAGGFLAGMDYRLTFFLTALAGVGALFSALLFVEPIVYERKKLGVRRYVMQIKGAVAEMMKNGVMLVILASALFGGIGTVNFWLSQPYFTAAGIPIILFGIAFALIYLAGALVSKFLSRLTTGWTAERVVLYGGIALGISSLLKSFVYNPVLSVCVALLAPMIMGLLSPTFQALVHKSISSSRRATIYSINTLLTSLAFVALGPVFGALADSSLPLSFLVLSAVAVMTGLLFYMLLSKDHAFKGRA